MEKQLIEEMIKKYPEFLEVEGVLTDEEVKKIFTAYSSKKSMMKQ